MKESFERPTKQAGRVDVDILLPLGAVPGSTAKREDPTMPARLREQVAERKQPSTQETLTQQHAERLSLIQRLHEGQELAKPFELTEGKPLPPVLRDWISNTVAQIKDFSFYTQTTPAVLRTGLEDMCYRHTWDDRIQEHSAVLMKIAASHQQPDESLAPAQSAVPAAHQGDAVRIQKLLNEFARDSTPLPLPASPSAAPSSEAGTGAGAATGLFGRLKKLFQ